MAGIFPFTVAAVAALLIAGPLAIAEDEAPRLTAEEQEVIETAEDDAGHDEPAFDVLVKNVRRWREIDDAIEGLEMPGVETLLNQPGEYRGQVFMVRGVLQQRSPLEDDDRGEIEGWFLRLAGGEPILVYMYQPPDIAPGATLAVPARFYKRVQYRDRAGRLQTYPAFVGARPQVLRAGSADTTAGVSSELMVYIVPVGVLGIVFFIIWLYVRMQGRPGRRHRQRGFHATDSLADGVDDDRNHNEPLPADPADALAELQRRASGSEADA